MKRTVLLLVLMVLLSGCLDQQANWQAEKQAKRVELEQRFQNVYGDQWEEKLLEYDIEREKTLLATPVIPPASDDNYFQNWQRQRQAKEQASQDELYRLNQMDQQQETNRHLQDISRSLRAFDR
ncbi:hypothetical protein KAR91_01345 [Candidatus Pacearchaeota archaeon]|nr:hypothetical protein [Candidatus Pacearchaeota archaeon]